MQLYEHRTMLLFVRETLGAIQESVMDEVDFDNLRPEDIENLLHVGYLAMALVNLDAVLDDAMAQERNRD